MSNQRQQEQQPSSSTTDEDLGSIPSPPVDPLEVQLQRLHRFLYLIGFDHSTRRWQFLSCVFGFGIVLPVVLLSISCSFSFHCLIFQCSLLLMQFVPALVSFYSIPPKLRRHGMRHFLFLHRHEDQIDRLRDKYLPKLKAFTITWWMLLGCIIVKCICEIVWTVMNYKGSRWKGIPIVLFLFGSWTYFTTIYVSACLLFITICNFQLIHYQEYVKLFENMSEVRNLLEKHILFRVDLFKISHRFRWFLITSIVLTSIGIFIVISQRNNKEAFNLINVWDFVVAYAIQLAGIGFCLRAAVKVTHSAHEIAAIASKWHAEVTCIPAGGIEQGEGHSAETAAGQQPTSSSNESDSDTELRLVLKFPEWSRYSVSSYEEREVLVGYLRANPSGITLYGLSVDRSLMITLFYLELSVVFFVLSNARPTPLVTGQLTLR